MFKNLFKKKSKKETTHEEVIFPDISLFKKMNYDFSEVSLNSLYDIHYASSFEKYELLLEATSQIENPEKGFTFSNIVQNGTISMNNNIYKVQILGTYSLVNYSWKWIWDYPDDLNYGYDLKLKKYAHELKKYGENHNLSFLTEPMYSKENPEFNHVLGMVCTGILNSPTFISLEYKAESGNGAMLIAFERNQDIIEFKEFDQPRKIIRISSMLNQMLMNGNMRSQFETVINYLISKDCLIYIDGNDIFGAHNDDKIKISFDEQKERIMGINVSLK